LADIVFERIFLLIFHLKYTNIKRQKPRSPDLIGTRMSENTVSANEQKVY
jgi:hypothetical protein